MTAPTVRAKFFVTNKNYHHSGHDDTNQSAEISFAPVFGSYAGNKDKEENLQWSKYTPHGELKMTVTNPVAIEAFELGKAYYLDFTPCD